MTPEQHSRVVAEAHADASLFAEEFPGQILDPAKTDWDGTAWEQAPDDLRDLPGAWELYSDELVRQVGLRVAAYCDRVARGEK